jgi:hypothetical protein
MEPEDSLPHSQELSTCPYPDPGQSSPHHPILYPPTYVLSFLVVSFPVAFLPVTYMRFSSPHSWYMPLLILVWTDRNGICPAFSVQFRQPGCNWPLCTQAHEQCSHFTRWKPNRNSHMNSYSSFPSHRFLPAYFADLDMKTSTTHHSGSAV